MELVEEDDPQGCPSTMRMERKACRGVTRVTRAMTVESGRGTTNRFSTPLIDTTSLLDAADDDFEAKAEVEAVAEEVAEEVDGVRAS